MRPTNDAIVFDELEKRHVAWDFYTGGGPPGASTLLGSEIITRYGTRHPVNTIDVNSNESFGNAGKVSGTQTKLFWGVITNNDY